MCLAGTSGTSAFGNRRELTRRIVLTLTRNLRPRRINNYSSPKPQLAAMLAIQSTSTNKTVTPNILPCAIKHSGPVSSDPRYWNPSTESDGTSTAFFRGRKLRGKKLALPEAYQGVVLQKTDRKAIAKPSMPVPGLEAEDADAPKEIDTMIMEQHATFSDVMVWDHEAVPDGDDVYVKGMEEWIDFAEAVSSLVV
jgi:ribonuclease H2 subunit C